MADTTLPLMAALQPTALRIMGCTFTGTTITDYDAVIDFPSIVKAAPEFAAPATSSEVKYFDSSATVGRTAKILNTAVPINAQTGDNISEDAAASIDKMACEVWCTRAQRDLVKAYKESGAPLFVMSDEGVLNSSQLPDSYQFLLGKITEFNAVASDGMYVMSFTISGGTVFTETPTDADMAAFNTDAAISLASTGRAAITIPDLASGEWDDLIAGKWVSKDAA